MRADVALAVVTTLDAKYANLSFGLYLRLPKVAHLSIMRAIFSPQACKQVHPACHCKTVVIKQAVVVVVVTAMGVEFVRSEEILDTSDMLPRIVVFNAMLNLDYVRSYY